MNPGIHRPIYLDYHATTPCDPRVVERMIPYFSDDFGNASSGWHVYGRRAAHAIDDAREAVAALIGVSPSEIIFTSGATESNNLVISGIGSGRNSSRHRVIVSSIEHKAVLEPARALREQGFEVIELPVDHQGIVDLEAAERTIDLSTLLVSVQAANNELGTIQPIGEIAALARSCGALFHTDAAQSVGKVPTDIASMEIDFASVSGHKVYGPKGVGALFVRRGARNRLAPLLRGGDHEYGLRAGTLNVPGIVGLGEAFRISLLEMESEAARIADLRDRLESSLTSVIDELQINGHRKDRLPGSSSLTFPDIDSDTLISNLPDLALSTSSACTSGAIEPSHVLTAIGLARDQSDRTIRVGIGRFTTSEEVDTAMQLIGTEWIRLSAEQRGLPTKLP